MSTVIEILQRLGACRESIAFITDNNISTLSEAWDKCQRGDWLLWLAAKAGVKRETVVFAACQCARTALKYTNDERVLRCIDTTEAWCRGEATIDQVVHSRRAAANAVAAFASASAAYSAEAAVDSAYASDSAYGADASDDAASAAVSAADAAYAAAYAADAAYADDSAASAADAADVCARKASQLETANLVRANIPFSAVEEALK